MELTCIVCPNSCVLSAEVVSGKVNVTGAKCPRGNKFAENELTNPMRSVTSSVKCTAQGFPVVSVKTNGEIPKNKIFELMELLSNYILTKSVKIGTILISNVFDTGVDVVTTTEMED